MIENVTIVGMGCLGILLGDAFSQSLGPGHVTFLADGDRLERYQRDGAWCNGRRCDFRFQGPEGEPAELVIFAVKSPDLEAAMELARPRIGSDTIIVSMLNGVTSEETLGMAFGQEKVIPSVSQGMDALREGNRVTYTAQGTYFFGLPEEDYFDRQEKLDAVLAVFGAALERVVAENDIMHRMWCKFMLNVGVNQVCMAYETNYAGVQAPGEARDTLIAAMNEARKIGACQGVLLTQKDLQTYLAVMDGINPEGMPSMRQDGLAHRRTEVDLFAGTIMAMARRYGMAVPVNETLYQKIREMETNWCVGTCQG